MIRVVELLGFSNLILFSDENEGDLDIAPSTSSSVAAPSMPLLDEAVEPGPSGITHGGCVVDDTASGEAV